MLLSTHLPAAVSNGKDLKARTGMLRGALYAGQAFANAPVAAVHALAYPLGGHFHIPHGLSNALVLTEVMRFNASKCSDLYAELAPYIMDGELQLDESDAEMTERLIQWLENRVQEVGLPLRLRDCGVTEESLPMLASEAMKQQRLLVNNPRELSEADALKIYQAVY